METWKTIKDYEGLYEVSNTGQVRSILTGKLLKGAYNSKTAYTKYKFVQLYKKNEKRKNAYVHLLVYDHFIGKDRTGYTVDHIDNDRSNNNVDNLQLITHRLNCVKDRKSPGVYYHKKKQAWMARISINGKTKHLGMSKDKEKALEMYKKAFDSIGGV